MLFFVGGLVEKERKGRSLCILVEVLDIGEPRQGESGKERRVGCSGGLKSG